VAASDQYHLLHREDSIISNRGIIADRVAEISYLLGEKAYTLGELANHFSCSKRTIKRTVDSMLHFPIIEERQGHEVLYSFPPERRLRPTTFTAAELATLLIAEESIAGTGLTELNSPFAGHARTLLTKVRSALDPSLQLKPDAFRKVFGTASVPSKDFSKYSDFINRLIAAALDTEQVKLDYFSLTKDRVFSPIVDPYAVYFDPDGATIKMIGYDHSRKFIANFSIDHIRKLVITKRKFTRPSSFDFREFLIENCFNGIHGTPVSIQLRTHGSTARVFAERKFHRSQQVIKKTPRTGIARETTTIQMRVASGRGLIRFILSWLPDIEVLSPAEIRQEVVNELDSAISRFR
jgi:predicted DNA-binding transcriptional regulator YafY